jgi:hypothetical protein
MEVEALDEQIVADEPAKKVRDRTGFGKFQRPDLE